MGNNTDRILNIAEHFQIAGKMERAHRFGSGHINDTYRLDTSEMVGPSYLLQRINHFIFPDVQKLMENMVLVCEHLQGKLAHLGQEEVQKKSLTIIPTKDGKLYYEDEGGNSWRMLQLIKDTHSVDTVKLSEQAYAGGAAFGEFQRQLSDLDARKLHIVLPRFHDIDYRLENLNKALLAHPVGRATEPDVQRLLKEIGSRESVMRQEFQEYIVESSPLRIIHNDTKFNNILLDKNDEPQCVIDLDTVMPGFVAFDFGDAIRTIINRGQEDDPDLNHVTLNIPLFEAYAQGYLQEAGSFLTDAEIDSLFYGVYQLPFMQTLRFLTDYIENDPYYKIQYPTHNLIRAKAQFKLLTELELNRTELHSILLRSVIS
ncbi:aminoglycoside phosphotransferase family protein [Sphingobacterium sp. lm-10]|uniref:phosphotransferase enzyme family protein n=1 Tax=Sphingobacterium sp. lm-10 TaxID=2944904 RepID=UPI00201FCC7A|nr:aminoglycoside phosphotransferase family protein [Sphingobacterium sp. lm-10]MCL7987512.1 aminoglycoside phosphotransferase family protein [Sphingobacterium sp. lm-10]